MLISTLFSTVNSENPAHPVIRMLEQVAIFENYLEPGMLARVVGMRHDGDDVLIADLVLTEFDDYNKQFETNHYYDKNGVPCLTARESGNFSETLALYLDLEMDAEKVFELIPSEAVAEFTDPITSFERVLSEAQAKNRHELGCYSLSSLRELAMHLFMKGDVKSPLAVATRSCLSAKAKLT